MKRLGIPSRFKLPTELKNLYSPYLIKLEQSKVIHIDTLYYLRMEL